MKCYAKSSENLIVQLANLPPKPPFLSKSFHLFSCTGKTHYLCISSAKNKEQNKTFLPFNFQNIGRQLVQYAAWKVSETATKSKLEADNAKQCYLEIACKIRQSGAYLLGSASEYKTIYVPFGDTWEQGKRHIYTLIFGGGYDDQGEAVLNPIQFDAETTGWVDADKDVNVQP